MIPDYLSSTRFLSFSKRLKPRVKNIFPPWNLNWVLEGLSSPPFTPINNLLISILTFKTISLVANTSARRVSELPALSVQEPFLVIHEDRLVFKDPSFLPKVGSQFHQ